MKRSFILTTLVLLTISLGYTQGIDFRKSGWSDALVEAKKSNKLIFLDAYTTWCGPCKYMDKNVFTDSAVGSFYNKHFINVKLDMERGEGVKIGEQLDVQGYPSLFFVNGDQEIVQLTVGAIEPEDMIEIGKSALDPSKTYYQLREQEEDGTLDADDSLALAEFALEARMDNFEELAYGYLKGKDWNDTTYMPYVLKFAEPTITSKLTKHIIDNVDRYIAHFGREDVESHIDGTAISDAELNAINVLDLDALVKHMHSYYPKEKVRRYSIRGYLYVLMYSLDKEEVKRFVEEAPQLIDVSMDMGARFYNAAAWEMQSNTSDPKKLEQALTWVDKSISEDENFYSTDTKAHILCKQGKNIEALHWAQKAVKYAKKTNEDASMTLALIKKISG